MRTRSQPTARRNPPESLKPYARKRDFTKSPEPAPANSPARKSGQKSLAYCIQKHLASHLHYDFRLEHNGVLLSWAVPKGPSLNPRDKRLAMRVEDHPFDYRTFEGVIPSGYGAGVVMLWDEGTWSPEPGFENIAAALQKGELKFRLDGVKLKGSWVLVRTGGGGGRGGAGGATETGEREHWLLIKHRDPFAGDLDVTTAAPRSVTSDHTFEQILKSDPAIWNSHEPGAHDELEKIVRKVIALEESTSPSRRAPSKRAAPRKKSPRT